MQISNASVHDNLDDGTQAGARINMRQAYLTIGGGWGQVLAGRELSLYQRENILNDMTLFGTGASGGGLGAPGTTLGRSGFGYIYPNFNARSPTPPRRRARGSSRSACSTPTASTATSRAKAPRPPPCRG